MDKKTGTNVPKQPSVPKMPAQKKQNNNGWIPTSERLPEPKGCKQYLVTTAHFNPEYTGRLVMVDEYEARFKDVPPYWSLNAENDGVRVVAWMPLPEPYKG